MTDREVTDQFSWQHIARCRADENGKLRDNLAAALREDFEAAS